MPPDMRAVVYDQAVAGGDAATYLAMRQLYLFVRGTTPVCCLLFLPLQLTFFHNLVRQAMSFY